LPPFLCKGIVHPLHAIIVFCWKWSRVFIVKGLNMRESLLIAVIAGIIPLCANMAAGEATVTPLNSRQASPLSLAESLLVKQNYSAAKALLSGYLKNVPENNEALYLCVAVNQTEILDYESYSIEKERFINLADSVRSILESRLKKLRGKDSVQCLFYIANIDGGIGVIQGKVGKWFPAVKSSMASISLLKEVVKLDTTQIAAWLGMGIFHYYLSKSFKWLPFIDEGSEEDGIRNVERATRAPFPFGFAAKNSLCWILIERQEYRRADSLAVSVLADAPDNTIFLRIRCLIALWSRRFDDAVTLGKKLAQRSLERTPVNWSDLVLAYYTMSSANESMGREKEALAAANYILVAPIPRHFLDIPHIKKNLKKVLAIKKKYSH
jgi:tetratricopeptide (TPR) repeat protein